MALTLRTLGVFLGIALVWWSMAELVMSSTSFESGVRDVMAFSVFRDSARSDGGGLDIIDGGGLDIIDVSPCCDYATRGFQIALLTSLFGGIPMALLAWILRKRPMSSDHRPYLLAAFVFQFASMVIAFLPVVIMMIAIIYEPIDFEGVLWFAMLALIGLSGAFALPIWRRLFMNARGGNGWPISVLDGARSSSLR